MEGFALDEGKGGGGAEGYRRKGARWKGRISKFCSHKDWKSRFSKLRCVFYLPIVWREGE